jgi:hypothetical protein
MHTIKVGWWISLLHNSLFIKDKVEKKNHFQCFQSLGQQQFMLLLYTSRFWKWKIKMETYSTTTYTT